MTCVSVVSLCALLPGLASAQQTDTGGSGLALTTGVITSSTGSVVDGGANGAVNASGASTLITVDNATINNTTANDPGLNVFSTSSSGGAGVSAVFTGTNSIGGLLGAVTVSGVNENASLDTTAGGGAYAGGLNANSQAGSATILNGSNLITGSATQTGLTATAGGTGTASVASIGGSIASGYGISASSQGGDVTVGPGAGVTTAIMLNSSSGVGIHATTSGAGAITVKTGIGGTIDGGSEGVYADNSSGSGAINVTVGAAIGATTAPTGSAVDVRSGGGSITVNANASLASGNSGIYASSTGGAISVAAASTINSTSGSGVYANSVGQTGTTGGGAVAVGSAGQRVTGVTAGANGIFAAGAGDVTIYAGTVAGGTRGVLASSQSNGTSDGAVLIDVDGQVTAQNSYGVLGVNNGVLSTDTLTIKTAGVISTGGSAISAQSTAGDINITAGGPIVAHAGNGSGWDGVYAASIGSNTNFNININANSSVSGTWNGIDAQGAAQGAITIDAAGPVSGAYGAGVFASGAGDVSVTTGAVTSSNGAAATRSYNVSTGANDGAATNVAAGQGFGIAAVSTGGNVTVNASGLVTGGAAGGVLGQALGSGSVSITTAGVTAGAFMGVEADSNGGDVTVATNGAVSGASYGVFITNTNPDSAGGVTVTTGSTVTGVADYGVDVRSYGLGAVSVGTAGQRLGGLVTGGTTGIVATGAGDVSVYAGAVTGGTRGIVAANQGDNPNGAVVVDVNGPVTANEGYGIVAVNNGSLAANSITVNAGQVTATDGTGISAQGGGDITINASGPIVANAGANGNWDGIYADGEGDSLVTVKTTASVTGTWNGVEAYSNGTTSRSGLNITAGGPVTAGSGQAAILATAAGLGDVNVAVGAGATLTAVGGLGVSASSTTGAVNITTAAGSSIAPGATTGIRAISASGAITINQGGDIGAAGAGGTVGLGVDAEIQSTLATSDINIASTGSIYVAAGAGLQSVGIYAVNSGSGAINVTTNGVVDPGAYGAVLQGSGPVSFTATGGGVTGLIGVYAVSSGTGGVSIVSQAGSAITGAQGVGVQAVGGAGGATLDLAGAVTGATDAVFATSTGAGATTVTTKGTITGATSGLNLTAGTGGLNLTIGGAVTATAGPAVVATSASSATINVASGAVVSGLVTSPTQAVISLATASGQSSTINIASGAVVAAAAGSTFDVAIRATGGSVVVNNLGEIEGVVDFSALTGANTGTLTQAPGTLFVTSGTSNFGSANANFTNSGTLQTQGATTTFQFGGANNTFNNTGTVVVGTSSHGGGAGRVAGLRMAALAAPSTSSFVLANLTHFANAGALEMINGVAGDSIVAAGTAYVGSGAAKLAVDTAIGAPGGASDVLVVGSTSGRTALQIHDVGPAYGAYNPTGTVIVQGATHAGDFGLDSASSWYNASLFGGALDKPGLFFSQLGVDPSTKNTVLISAPKLQAYQFATLPAQAQSVWYDTTPQPERQGEVRDQLARTDTTGQAAPSVWFKVEGATQQRDVTQSWSGAGNSYSYDAGYTQDVTSELAGVDGLTRTADGWGVAWGMSGGYVDSITRFDQMGARTQADGFSLNGYVTLMRRGVFATASVGGDALRATLSSPRLTGWAPQSTDVASVGGTFETGVRTPFLFGAALEPSVGLAYVTSSIGDVAAAGARFHYGDPQSLRLSLGARVTGTAGALDWGQWRTRYQVSLRAVDDVDAANHVDLSSAGPLLPITDSFEKQFGEARLGLVSETLGGWSASADLRERFSGSSTDTGLSLALRYRF